MKSIKVFLIGNPNFSIEPTRSYLMDWYTFYHSNYKIQFVRLNKNILNLYALLLNQSDLILICLQKTTDRSFRKLDKQKKSIGLIDEFQKKFMKRILLWSCVEDTDTELDSFKGLFNYHSAFMSMENEYVVLDECIATNRVSWLQHIFYCFKIF